jgi:hypothetical protein
MASISIGDLKQLWKTVADWVNGADISSKPKVTIAGSSVTDVVLQDTATAIGNGTPFTVGSNKTLTIEINGTSTSNTIVFEGSSISGTYYAIQGVKLLDYTMASQTTGINELWTFDLTGLSSFRARISNVSGGSVSVKGKAVV